MIENAEELYKVKLMLNLLKYSQRYFATSGSFWNFYTDEIDDVNNNASNCKSFNIKSKNKKNKKKKKEKHHKDLVVTEMQINLW